MRISERLFEWVQFEDCGVKICNAIVVVVFSCLLQFDRARDIGVFDINDAAGTGLPACGRTKWQC